MRTLLLLLLAVLGLASAAATLKTGQYIYTSEIVSGGKTSVEASFIISFVEHDEVLAATTYSLKVFDIAVIAEKDRIVKDDATFALPFQFTRNDLGQVIAVKVHPDDSLESKNLKKSIADALQTSTASYKDHAVSEVGINGLKSVHYRIIHTDSQAVAIKGSYSQKDFLDYPKGSNMENGQYDLKVKKVTTMDAQDNSVSSVSISTVITQSADVSTVVQTHLEFKTAEVYLIQMIEEVDWVVENLVHVLDRVSRAETIKSRFPPVEVLVSRIAEDQSSSKEMIQVRSQLVYLANLCQKTAVYVVEMLSDVMASRPDQNHARIYNILARINAEEAQILLAEKIGVAKDVETLRSLLTALATMDKPTSPSVLVNTMLNLQVPKELKELYELSMGIIAQYLMAPEAEYILAPYLEELQNADYSRKIQLLHVLGNAGGNSPVQTILSELSSNDKVLRSTAILNLRNFLHQDDVQTGVMEALKQPENLDNKAFMNSLLSSIKTFTKRSTLPNGFAGFLSELALLNQFDDLLQLLKETGNLVDSTITTFSDIQSSTTIWNDTFDPNYNLIAPYRQRQDDVDIYPLYTAQLSASQFGPRPFNIKGAVGIFSGSNGGCLADDFKIFDKLIIELNNLGQSNVLGDVQLYIYTFNSEFHSRVYAIINGNVLLDFALDTYNCTSQEIVIFDGELVLFNNQTEIPIDVGTVLIYWFGGVHLEFDTGYIVCLSSSFLELYIVGKTDLTLDLGATATALGVVRVGLEVDGFLNYVLGPDTHLGSPNSTLPKFAGKLASVQQTPEDLRTCETCIGLYHGYDDQVAYIGAFIQRREGLGWGDPVSIPIFEQITPGVPFPTPISEVCETFGSP